MDAATSPIEIQVSVSVLKQLCLYLDALQVDKAAFLASIGLPPSLLQSPDAYISIETYLLIQDEAARYVDDPYFGLHMGEYAEPGSWSILGYLMMNCKNLGEAFEKSARYHRIIGNLIEGRAWLHFNKLKVVLDTPPHAPRMSRHCFEATIASTVRMMRTLTGSELSPLEVGFAHPEPPARAEYGRVLGCPVAFNQKETFFTLDLSVLRTPILLPNSDLQRHFEDYARSFVARLEHQHATTQAVTRIILANLDDEALTIRTVARQMAMSVRTLQNRLKDEGVVFSDLLQDIRSRLARQYLAENYPVEEITYLLGFSEPSVFRKAFKRWSGFTPRQYREQAFSTQL